MGKTFGFVMMAVVLVIGLQIMGFEIGVGSILDKFGISTSGIDTSISFARLFILAIIAGASVTGIAISFLTKSASENIILIPVITVVLVLFFGTFAGIANHALASNYPGFIQAIIYLIFGSISVGLLFSLVEFFRGTD